MITRRHLLASLGSVIALSPALAIAGPARPAPRTSPLRAHRVLVLALGGGVRSSACFIASRSKALNPWGVIDGVRLPLGKLLDDPVRPGVPSRIEGYQLRSPGLEGLRVPRLREITDGFAVLGTWDDERGDHQRSELVEGTGTVDPNAAGLLVRLYGALAETRKGSNSAPEVPPFAIGRASSLAAAPRGQASSAAVEIGDRKQLPGDSPERRDLAARTGRDFAVDEKMRQRLDDELLAHTGAGGFEAVESYVLQHAMGHRLRTKLANPAVHFDVYGDQQASLGTFRNGKRSLPLSNQMLMEILSVPNGGFGQGDDTAGNLALAIRLLQMGSPAVAVTMDGFDMHSGEQEAAPGLYGRLGAAWAALRFLLAHTEDPREPGTTMLDRTLVITTSEFGRDPGQPKSGFNGGGGSDHGSHPACFYLGHALMGAGIRGGKYHGAVDLDSFDARHARRRFSPQQLLATVLQAVGADPTDARWGFEGARPIPDVWA